MDFHTISRRQLQALSKKNKIPANITNLAMADALNALEIVEGIEEIMNPSELDVPQSPMVPPTGGRTRTAKAVGVLGTPMAAAPATAARRRAAAASTSVRKIMDDTEEGKKTPAAAAPVSRRRGVRETTVSHAYSTRRSTRLAENVGETKERSEVIKINSFNEEIDENVEVEMKENSVDQSEITEITVVEKFEECSEEAEVKSNGESKEISEEKSEIPNEGDVTVERIEEMVVATDFKIGNAQEEDVVDDEVVQEYNVAVTENVCEMETEGLEDNEMKSNVDEEAKDTEMSFNMDKEDEASFEITEMKSNVDNETEASIEEDTEMNFSVDEDTVVAQFKVADSSNVENDKQNIQKEQESYSEELEHDGHMIENVTVDMQETKDETSDNEENESSDDEESVMSDEEESDMSDGDCQEDMVVPAAEIQESKVNNNLESDLADDVSVTSFNQEQQMLVPEVEIKDELLNSEANHVSNFSAIGYAPPNNEDPLKKSAGKTPQTVRRLTQMISDDKENVDSGMRSIRLKDEKPKGEKALEDRSLRELTKMIKDLTISKKQLMNEEDGKEKATTTTTTTRPALKTLSQN